MFRDIAAPDYLQCEEHLHGVIVFKVFKDEWLDGLAHVFLGHLGNQRLKVRLGQILDK
jgi:hypothetical protein